ncbi:MAG: hypothetical protein AMS25_11255 [Gemmatimonas sp. SM23_52]|jgi:hypothetical protein|nr:MAG: hypothetical protein AMS25_11255 [Gemmatimonas sp. SM23_52]
MSEKSPGSFRRRFNRYIALATSVVGVLIIMSSFLFSADPLLWYAAVIIGLEILLIGSWYASNPILTSERRYPGLRQEVYRFTDLVRQLNRAAAAAEPAEQLQQVRAAMLESVERMVELAGKQGKASSA